MARRNGNSRLERGLRKIEERLSDGLLDNLVPLYLFATTLSKKELKEKPLDTFSLGLYSLFSPVLLDYGLWNLGEKVYQSINSIGLN